MTAYSEIAASASRIMDILGPCGNNEQKMTLSGRSPNLPKETFPSLAKHAMFDQLDASTRMRLAVVVDERVTSVRDHTLRQYWKVAEELHSLRQIGMAELDQETRLIKSFENVYQRFLNSVRVMLSSAVSRQACEPADRNARGGFGDVSTPSHLPKPN